MATKPAVIRRLIVSYILSAGRRVVVIEAILKVARQRGDAELIAAAEAAVEPTRKAFRLMRLWHTQRDKSQRSRPDAAAIDNALDRAISRVRNRAADFADMPDDDPSVTMANDFIDTFFPDGVAAITNQPYEEQLVDTEELVKAWQEPAWQNVIDALGLGRFTDLVATLVVDYREAVVTFDRRSVTWSEVKASEAANQDLMLSLIARILGHYPTDSEHDLEARTQYLEMFDEQNNLTAEYRRRRRGKATPDIDPDTGELLENEEVLEDVDGAEAETVTES